MAASAVFRGGTQSIQYSGLLYVMSMCRLGNVTHTRGQVVTLHTDSTVSISMVVGKEGHCNVNVGDKNNNDDPGPWRCISLQT
jgi:hypothetical protein